MFADHFAESKQHRDILELDARKTGARALSI